MTKNEQKRLRKRKWKKLKKKIYKKRKALIRLFLLIAAFICVVVLLVNGVLAAKNKIQTALAEKAAEEAELERQAILALTPTPTPEPTPDPTISIADGTLEKKLAAMIPTDGIWSIYLKNLDNDESFTINSQSMYAASLIKLFVLQDVYDHMDSVIGTAQNVLGTKSQSSAASYVDELLEQMITVSDNDAYNNLIALRDSDNSFYEGCLAVNEDIQNYGYTDTGIYSTLSPSDMETISTAEGDEVNHTNVEDCGKILEEIYNGTCVSEEASAEMLSYLLDQETTYKIPEGCPKGTKVANKTGETETSQHDAAIVYGAKTDYILCIMSSNLEDYGAAMAIITQMSEVVYDYLNP